MNTFPTENHYQHRLNPFSRCSSSALVSQLQVIKSVSSTMQCTSMQCNANLCSAIQFSVVHYSAEIINECQSAGRRHDGHWATPPLPVTASVINRCPLIVITDFHTLSSQSLSSQPLSSQSSTDIRTHCHHTNYE